MAATTAAAASAPAPVQPTHKPHTFVITAIEDGNCVVQDMTQLIPEFEGETKAIKDNGKDAAMLDKIVSFYDRAKATRDTGTRALAQLQEAVGKCHSEKEILTAKRHRQIDILGQTKTAQEVAKSSGENATELHTKIASLGKTIAAFGTKFTEFEVLLAKDCGSCAYVMGEYSRLGIGPFNVGTTFNLYSNEARIQHYKDARVKERSPAAAAAPAASQAKSEVPKPSPDSKVAEKPAAPLTPVAPVKASQPNPAHEFLVADAKALAEKYAALTPILAKKAEVKTGLSDKKSDIIEDVAHLELLRKEKAQCETLLQEMISAHQLISTVGLEPLSKHRQAVYTDVGFIRSFVPAFAKAQKDADELEVRIAHLKTWKTTRDAELPAVERAVGEKCFNDLYKSGKVWRFFTSYGNAIAQFKYEEEMEKQKAAAGPASVAAAAAQPVSAPVASQPVATVVIDIRGKAETAAKEEAEKHAAAQAKTSESKPASKKIHFLDFNPETELPALKNHQKKLEMKHQRLNFAILDDKTISPAEKMECRLIVGQALGYLKDHDPERLSSPLKVSQVYSESWRQANSLADGINDMLLILENTDSKHSDKSKDRKDDKK